MKQKIYIIGLITILVIFMGAVFKVNHWPAAGIMLTLGLVSMSVCFLPLAIIDHYQASDRKYPVLHFITWLTGFVVFTAMLFKLMHWPFAGILLMIAMPFPFLVFLPAFVISISKDKEFDINNLVAVLILLAINSVFAGFLALNVTRDRIFDSYNLSGNYITVESQVRSLPALSQKAAISLKIDETVKIINEYQDAILKQDENNLESWKSDPGSLVRPDAKGLAFSGLENAGYSPAGTKLAASYESLIRELSADSDYKELAEALPGILNYKNGSNDLESWSQEIFNDTSLSWVLIYLEGVKSDLLTIKASILL